MLVQTFEKCVDYLFASGPYADRVKSKEKKHKHNDFESMKPTNNWHDVQDDHKTSFSQTTSFWWSDHGRVSSSKVDSYTTQGKDLKM